MTSADLSKNGLAEKVVVGPKTVERWLTQDRCPHPRIRLKVARILGCEETYLWPELLAGARASVASLSEIVQIWPTRTEVPHDVWRSLMRQANEKIQVLVYAGGFLVESLDFVNVVREKSKQGAEIRILLGDGSHPNIQARAREEGLPSLPQRCHSTLEYLWETVDLPGVDIRTHHTVLYNSIYRFDDSILVNTHSYGAYAAKSPVQHLQQVQGGHLFNYYLESFEAAWATGEPAVL